MNLPTAHEVRHEGKRATLGCYAVRYDPYKRVSSHKWQVLGPPDAEGQEEVLDDFGTYREAVKDARARSRGEFGDTEGDDAPRRTPAQKAAKHVKAAGFYPKGSVGRAYHEAQEAELRSKPTAAIIDPKDPAHHDRPLWVVYGEQCMPSLVCAKLRAYTSDHALLPAGQAGPVVCIWGYSVFKRVPGFRTLGSSVDAWACASGSMKPVFFDRQEEALGLLRKLTTPKSAGD